MNIVIKEVNTKRELKKFINFQFSLYKNNKFWVPPLKMDELKTLRKDKNPAFDFCEAKYWLAYSNNKIVGRIAAIINHKSNERWNEKAVRFGWIDFEDNIDIVKALFNAIENWAREKNMNVLHGPLGFTDMDGEGTLTEGFNEVSILGSIYNYAYYPKLIENVGFQKYTDWVEYQITGIKEVPEKIKRIAEISLNRNKLKILKVNKSKELLPYAKEIFYVLNAAYKNLFGFVELSDKQIDMYVKQYFSFIIPDYLPVVLDSNNKVAAFGITMPSMSYAFQKSNGKLFPFGIFHILKAMKNNHALDLYLTAVRPDLQDKGVNAILMYEINKIILKNNIEVIETNRELEDNPKVQAQWKFFNSRLHKRRRCYKKELN